MNEYNNSTATAPTLPVTDRTYTPPDEFTFSFPRLVKEVDTLVNDRVTKSVGSIDVETSKLTSKALNAINQEEAKALDSYKEGANKVLEDIKNDLIAEIERGRSVIHVNNTISINVGHSDHPQAEKIYQTLTLLKKTLLVGKAGTGKTYMAEKFAEKIGIPFYKYSCSRDSSVHDLIGYMQPRSEVYLEPGFIKAYENGGVFLLDEFDAMPSDMALFFNGVADNSKNISIPHRISKPVAEKHPDFYLILSGNTWGNGSIEYSGRDFQDLALLDRFRLGRHDVKYHVIFEKAICDTIDWSVYPKLLQVREYLEKTGSYLSTRNIEDVIKLYKQLEPNDYNKDVLKQVLLILVQDLEEDLQKSFNEVLTELFSR